MSRVRSRPLTAAVVLVVLVGLGVFGVGVWQMVGAEHPVAETGERTAVDSLSTRIDDAPASPPVGLEIPALRFEAPIEPLSIGSDEVLDPPTAGDAFWLSDYGLPGVGTDNTVYLVGHTSSTGDAVFDPLVDLDRQQPRLQPGDEIVVRTEEGAVLYEVLATERQDKTAITDLETVWRNEPGRLVIITCFFAASRTEAPDNLIVYARQRSAPQASAG
ncbi:class F sortase [Leucobacter celer]|uniref:class F sortase n=1 Tax=Leucobacter celer TaxID=668625 RepID=UPI000B00EA07|nr:class F sortase [Leucobacter celer]